MHCTIDWNALTLEDWNKRFVSCPRSTLLQSYNYARGVCPIYGQKARWGQIFIDGQEAGLVQILEAGILWDVLHAVILDRGPLWFEGFGSAVHIKLFFEEFNKQFPGRLGRTRRIIPEVEESPASRSLFDQLPLKRQNFTGYQTRWLDLTQDEDVLRASFHKKWRNLLNKAERQDLKIEWDDQGLWLSWLMEVYQADKGNKGYQGVDPSILQNIVTSSLPDPCTIIGKASVCGRPVSAILMFCHGRSATYQVGWVSREGRSLAANYKLLWEALLVLKDKSIKEFDLGGVNDDSAAGVKKFKSGMGGEESKLVGLYH